MFAKKEGKGKFSVTNSPNTTVQSMVDSPNSTQIYTERGIDIQVNPSSKPKKLTEKSKNLILSVINQYPEKEILIKTNLGDHEVLNYAKSIKDFIKSKTNKIVQIKRAVYGNPITGTDMIHVDRKKIEITVSSK